MEFQVDLTVILQFPVESENSILVVPISVLQQRSFHNGGNLYFSEFWKEDACWIG